MKSEIWDPFEDLEKFQKKMNRLFKEFWGGKVKIPKDIRLREPLVDIEDKKNEYVATVELPGMKNKDIEVNVEGNLVQIKAERKKSKEEKKKSYFKQERTYKGFYKAFSLPGMVDDKKVKVNFDKGILTIRLPKKKR